MNASRIEASAVNEGVHGRFRRLSQGLAGVAAATAALALLGWATRNEGLEELLPGTSAIRPNTAAGILLGGFSLLLLSPQGCGCLRRRLGQLLAGLLFVVGALTLAEYLFGWDAGIDQLLFNTVPSSLPPRMSQLGAMACTLLGLALLLLDWEPWRGVRPAQFCALAACFIGTLGLLGYTFGAREFYTAGFTTSMTFPTALTSAMVGLAVLLVRPDAGWLKLFSSPNAGGVMLRRLLPLAVALPWALGWLSLKGARLGWYGMGVDQVFFAAPLIGLLTLLLCLNARFLERTDVEREQQRLEVERLNRELEERVERRTAELAGAMSTLQAEMLERQRASRYARSLIEASLDPLVTISRDGKIMDVNRATELVTGISRERLIGTDFSNYFTEPEKAREGYLRVFQEGRVQDYPLAIRNSSGAVTDVLYDATVFENQAGEVEGVFAAARDVTERKRMEAALRAAHDELEDRVRERTAELAAANQELEAFTSSVSHDLRAPLRHIQSFARLLAEQHAGRLDAEGQHYLERIRGGTERMSRLVDDLLKLARVGRQALQLLPTSLNELVAGVVRELETAGRQIDWRIGELPTVTCDPLLAKQVFFNLLANSVKFTRLRERAVIEVGPTESRGKHALFVRDNGVGFDMKYADRLFGAFQRLHRPEDFEGSGVGLATVWRIVRKHGGDIWAEAAPDRGATFYFTLGFPEAGAPDGVAEEKNLCMYTK